jgi:predicted  nucleic acid-binding Zn-ribbon protein
MESLIKLDRLDRTIRKLLALEAEIPKRKNRFQEKRQRLDAELQAAEERLRQAQMRIRSLEGDVKQKEESIRKLRGQSQNVKKNEEYRALLMEIENEERQKTQLEEQIIEAMYEVDAAKAALEETRKRVQSEAAQIEEECKKIDEELVKAQKERAEIEQQRAAVAKSIEESILQRYERVRALRTDGAVVPLRGDVCSGCNRKLTPQMVNEVLNATKIHFCTYCGRIVYNPDVYTLSEVEVQID